MAPRHHRRHFLRAGAAAAGGLAVSAHRAAAGQPAPAKATGGLRIVLTSVMVDDQDKALKFYTDVLGFVKKNHIPDIRWLTVVSPAAPDGVELLLEPMGFPPSRAFQKAVLDAGIPWASFGVDDIQREFERLSKRGVVFRRKPVKIGPVTTAVFEDTCGNLIQIAQQ
jgi:catechol 2,3-dioxygenase-like lactoylglutathione lyase family enzyme